MYLIFFLEIKHSLDTFTSYSVLQIVDELTISPLIRNCERPRCKPGFFVAVSSSFPVHIYFIFSLEIEHSLDTFTGYYVLQIVDELTISPLIRRISEKAPVYTGVFSGAVVCFPAG